MRKTFFFLLFCALLANCRKQSMKDGLIECYGPQVLTLTFDNCSNKFDQQSQPAICFKAVQDSRCPIDANCIWQGVAVADFTLKAITGEHKIRLATSKLPGFPSTDTVVAGVHIQLVEINPYPGAGTGQTTAKLRIN